MVWTEHSLKEKENCAISEGIFQEEVSHTWSGRQSAGEASTELQASTDHTKMPSQMEHAMETMMFTFHKFAGDKGYLTKEDLRVLMEKEFPGFLEAIFLSLVDGMDPTGKTTHLTGSDQHHYKKEC
ncbi:protein S100-A10 isoform X2 [Symphalangus syndactylus]|uniref:protein S100-A10 isoform X2 n=1 Tax=Symphalangus syndactylus TaxID=9590 RepID=UPI0030042354